MLGAGPGHGSASLRIFSRSFLVEGLTCGGRYFVVARNIETFQTEAHSGRGPPFRASRRTADMQPLLDFRGRRVPARCSALDSSMVQKPLMQRNKPRDLETAMTRSRRKEMKQYCQWIRVAEGIGNG
jgi:hypothetical protein